MGPLGSTLLDLGDSAVHRHKSRTATCRTQVPCQTNMPRKSSCFVVEALMQVQDRKGSPCPEGLAERAASPLDTASAPSEALSRSTTGGQGGSLGMCIVRVR